MLLTWQKSYHEREVHFETFLNIARNCLWMVCCCCWACHACILGIGNGSCLFVWLWVVRHVYCVFFPLITSVFDLNYAVWKLPSSLFLSDVTCLPVCFCLMSQTVLSQHFCSLIWAGTVETGKKQMVERMGEGEQRMRECVCMCVWERKIGNDCVCVCVCVCMRERESACIPSKIGNELREREGGREREHACMHPFKTLREQWII